MEELRMIVGRGRFWICATLVAVVGLAAVSPASAALFGLWKSPKKKIVVPKQYVVVFPFDQGDLANVPADFGTYVATDLRTMLSDSDKYNVLLYRDRLSPIARATGDNSLTPTDAGPPFTPENRAKTSRLAQLLASDFYVIGSVDDFQVKASEKVALITISAELIDTKTGKLLKTLVVTGRTPENVKSTEGEELRDLAKGDAVAKLTAEILAPKKTSESESETPAASEPAKPEPQPEPNKEAPPENPPAKADK
jgi:hypothetical protein